MNCYRFEELISAYIENNLTLQDKAEAELHLEVCDQCRKNVIDLKVMISSMNSMPKLSCSDDFVLKLENRIQSQTIRSNKIQIWNTFQKYSKLISAVAAVILVFMGFYMTYTAYYPNLNPTSIPQAKFQKQSISPQKQTPANQMIPQYISRKNPNDTTKIGRPDLNNKIKLVNDTK